MRNKVYAHVQLKKSFLRYKRQKSFPNSPEDPSATFQTRTVVGKGRGDEPRLTQ